MPEEMQMPATEPAKKASSIVWHIVLITLIVLGVGLLYWKLDSDSRALHLEITSVKSQMDADRVMFEEKIEEMRDANKTIFEGRQPPFDDPNRSYRIEFPGRWTQETINGLTFTSEPGILFNINTAKAFGLEGYEEIKNEEYTNAHGVRFSIAYKQPVADPDDLFDLDPNTRLVLISSDVIGDIVFYNYNAIQHPDALTVLTSILNSVDPSP
ncbi:MAG: hypothetical protein NUV81_01405 [bacterium]|nr:hypothetical protein [bacterium]